MSEEKAKSSSPEIPGNSSEEGTPTPDLIELDDTWQRYTDGIITLVELWEYRQRKGLKGDWMKRMGSECQP